MWSSKDTITAVATPRGVAALAVIRISGDQTKSIVKKCFDHKGEIIPRKVMFGYWGKPEIDQVTAIYYEKGHGFTGEEALEIICHGNPIIADQILSSITACGARVAKPGEFSYRAVLNEKIDLIQADSILSLIHARSPLKARQALLNLKGRASSTLKELTEEVINLLAHLEATIDFSSEDIEPMEVKKILQSLDRILHRIEELSKNFQRTEKFEKGFTVALMGEPNVGKSSFFNLIVGRDRSIVSSVPGTTRDTVESQITLDKLFVTFVDTAGIRDSNDLVEIEGIKRASTVVEAADLILFLADATNPKSQELGLEQAKKLSPGQSILLCRNKIDLQPKNTTNENSVTPVDQLNGWLDISCKDGTGLESVISKIQDIAAQNFDLEGDTVITSKRQNHILIAAKEDLLAARGILLLINSSIELAAVDLRNALDKLKELQCEELGDEILDKVFKEFCIGK